MFEKIIEKIVGKQLPGIEARLQATLKTTVVETVDQAIQALETRLMERFKGLDDRLSAEVEGHNKLASDFADLEKDYADLNEKLEAFPSPDDIVTSDTLGDELGNHDVLTDADEFIKQGDFDPSEYDLVTTDELPDVDDIVEKATSTIVEKLKEALDGLSV